jgi:hypothetical protein
MKRSSLARARKVSSHKHTRTRTNSQVPNALILAKFNMPASAYLEISGTQYISDENLPEPRGHAKWDSGLLVETSGQQTPQKPEDLQLCTGHRRRIRKVAVTILR